MLIISQEKRAIALKALEQCPEVEVVLVVDGPGDGKRHPQSRRGDVAGLPATPIADEPRHGDALFVGHDRPAEGHPAPLPEQPPAPAAADVRLHQKLWRYREGMIVPLACAALPLGAQAAVNLMIRCGGTAIIMERFDPEHYLQLVEKYRPTHSQLVPTMFSRMLKLPEEVREKYDVSSLEIAIHAAAPCPVQVKEQMIEWWGPIIQEYYGATEGLGFTACDSRRVAAHRGTVGKVRLGELHVLDEEMKPMPEGRARHAVVQDRERRSTISTIRRRPPRPRSADGTMSTVGDVG